MAYLGSWKFWVIIALALGTLACAGRAERRERKEMAREERRERLEQRRAERQRMIEERRAQRDAAPEPQPRAEPQQRAEPQPAAAPARQTAAASFTPVAAPVTAAAVDASSKLVFMRVSKQTSGTDAALFDVTDSGGPRFIGMVNAASKLSYPLNPGLYTFMVVGETAEFMQANIAGGKTYYALVIPKSGAKRFAIEPVRQNEIGGKEFVSWDKATRPMTGNAGSYNPADAAEKRGRYWSEWVRKAESERAELTINTEDGR